MADKYMSQDELQHIEHGNKVLREHLELRKEVVKETEEMLNTFLPVLQAYVDAITQIRKIVGEEVSHIIKSSRELKIITGSTTELVNFTQAVIKLESILTPSLVDKLKRLTDAKY